MSRPNKQQYCRIKYLVSDDGTEFLVTRRVKTHLPEVIRESERATVPFDAQVLSPALNQHRNAYDFERWSDVIACCSFLNVPLSAHCVQLSNLVTMEIVRAAGNNLFHFDEACVFMNVLYTRDRRMVPVGRNELERLYWFLVTSKCSDITETVKDVVGGVQTYEECVDTARALKRELHRPHDIAATVHRCHPQTFHV